MQVVRLYETNPAQITHPCQMWHYMKMLNLHMQWMGTWIHHYFVISPQVLSDLWNQQISSWVTAGLQTVPLCKQWSLRPTTHPTWITHPCQTYARCSIFFISNGWAHGSIITWLYHHRCKPRFEKSAEILGHCWATSRTIMQAVRLKTHPKWIIHPWQTYARWLTTFICNGWAHGFIITWLYHRRC